MAQEANPFSDTEQQSQATTAPDIDPQEENGGNPGDPVPVDDYVPLLFLAAAGIIIATAYRKKTA